VTASLVNLCFHGVGTPRRELEPGEGRYWVTTGQFLRILDEVADDLRVRISFDDGNASDAAVALPALVERGLDATFFVLAGRLDTTGSLSRDDVRGLVAAGMRVGSHGMDHVPWRHQDEATLQRELVDARDELTALTGSPVTEAALPLGRYDRSVLGRARQAGYDAIHTSDRCWARGGAWLQPRFSVRQDDTAESVRRDVLGRAALAERLRSHAVRIVKRLR
jgi:peptidoglycan/xylan/chitin deacetylase (PgdA/CDA1 family)